MKKSDTNKTMTACYIGYIVQAIVNNFVPLLFVTLESQYQIPLSKITLLITMNFLIQLLIDLLSAGFIDKIGYRASIILAHIFSILGLSSLTFLPEILPDPFIGILISVMIYAVGGGLIEVLVSPMVEACPSENKEKAMSLLHSFYCWGHVGVVLLSTLFFFFFTTANWKILTLLWALIPLFNLILFFFVPIYPLNEEGEKGCGVKDLFRMPAFWILILMMFCSGASEQAVSQWASTFAEQGLGVSKTIGDLAGPMSFAVLMGMARLLYGKFGEHMNLNLCMISSTLLCILSYLIIGLCPLPVLSLIGCAVCGFSVGILWPGTFSKASREIRNGGTVLFAFLALAGDLGCTSGPTLAGLIAEASGNNLHYGVLSAILFPALLFICLLMMNKKKKDDTTLRK